METQQLHPLVDGKVPQRIDGRLGVYYAGQFVEVFNVDGQFFTELSVDEIAKQVEANNPDWRWNDDDTAATASAVPWPTAPVDPDSRTYEAMVSATEHERRRLLSNRKPLKLKPEDDASLREEIRAALARQKGSTSSN